MIDKIPMLAWSCSRDGATEFLNQVWLDYTGLPREKAVGWGWKAAIHPEDLDKLMSTWLALLASGEPGQEEARLRRFDGEYRWFLFRAVPVRNEQGRIVRWYGTNTDIEDLKRAEALLTAEKKVLEMIVAGANLTDILNTLCRIVDAHASDTITSVLLMDREGKRLWPAAGPRVPAGWSEAITPLEIGPNVGSCGAAAFRKDTVIVSDIASDPLFADHDHGSYRDLALSYGLRAAWSQPLISKTGEVLGTFAMYFTAPRSPAESDLELIKRASQIALIAIERKRTESALQESEERFRQMADTIPEVIWITSLEPEKLLYVSPSFERIWSLPVSELYQNPRLWTETIHPEDRERVVGTFSRWIAGEQGGYHDIEFRIIQTSGAVRWIHERGVMTLNEQGKPYRFSGISTDITERKHAEEELQRSEAYLAETQRLSWTGTLGWNVASGAVFWSKETFCILGYDPGTRPSLDLVLDRVHPEDAAIVRETFENASRREADINVEYRLLVPDGRIKHLHVVARAVTDISGKLEFVGALSDVTASKLAQEQIRQNERELRQLIDAVPQHVFVLEADGRHLYSNRVAREYHGLTPQDPQVDHLAYYAHPQDLESALAHRRRFVARGEAYEMEVRLRGADGQYRWFLIRCKPLSDQKGRVLRWYGTRTDIEDRKRAEVKLQQDERELRRITDAIPDAIVVLAPDGAMLHVNQRVLDYTGLSLDDIRSGDFLAKLFYAEDFERSRSQREQALARGEPFEAESRVRRKDGQYRWFLIRYHPLRDDQGQVIRWYATGIDIDDRKQAEERIAKENLALREEIDHSSMFEEIVGSSPALRRVLGQVAKVAPVDSTVLILGETGTGKELIARAIHKRSKRVERAFVRVNCAAIPATLIASELFGHEKGAFTGALQRRLGRFELADGGTIFLDEVGELPAETQIALLRVLQEREIERVGGDRPIAIDVRVLAATNRDLAAAVAAGRFRDDLFYRLNVFPIRMPSLRERIEDIPLLVEYFVERYGKNAGKKFRQISKKTLELFQSYDWPGNIRELQNVVERAVVLCDGEIFSVDSTWLKREVSHGSRPTMRLGGALLSREKEIIETALQESRGKIAGSAGAAVRLGIPRQTLESKIKRLRIDVHRFKSRQSNPIL